MAFPDETITQPIIFTLPAAQAVRDVMTTKNLQGYALRLYIAGGGCSGYQYALALDNKILADDSIIDTDGIKLIVDKESIKFLQGATVDYVDGLTNSGFKINNPNAVSSCNCGQSFNSSDEEASGSCSGCR
jgi:iron-sulfur cluster assembly accessory protein